MVIVSATILLKFLSTKIETKKFMNFCQAIIEDMAQSVDFLTKKLEETKTANDIFSEKDLSDDQNFLNAIIDKFGKEFKHCEVSFYLSKTSMTICCETLTVTEAIANNLIKIVEQLIEEHFFSS